MTRRYGERIEPGRTYKTRPGAYAILARDGKLLLTHQAEPVPEIQLPGGGIDPGEATVPALHREALEETGWRVGRLRKFGVYRRFTYMPEYDFWAEKICHIYVGRPVLRMGPPSEPGHTALWVPFGLAGEALHNQGDREMLERWLKS
ncbi:MAG: NUDIX hydrolase [Pseudomonadota bacterium]